MPLTELWKNAHKEIQDKHIQQVIGFAGDGKLRDGSEALIIVGRSDTGDLEAQVRGSRHAWDYSADQH